MISQQIKIRLEEMGYEYISNDDNIYSYKCPYCGTINISSKETINKEYNSKRWKLCSNCEHCNISIDNLLSECKKTNNTKSFISSIKQSKMYIDELNERTKFLNEYDVDINERVYYIWNELTEIVKCKYCDKKAKWSGRLTTGYKTTCCSKECEHKRISEQKSGSTSISDNRLIEFIEWQDKITKITDNDIKEHLKYEKYLKYITNNVLLEYLDNRFNDSYSREETLNRILYSPIIEKKPICANPTCNNPVKWIGRERALYTTYCSDKCASTSIETISKKKKTNKENWGTENVYDSEKYKQQHIEKYGVPYNFQRDDVIEKSNDSKLIKYGTIYPSQTDEIKNKVRETNKERYGVANILLLDYVREKTYSEETRQKITDSYIEHYGTSHPMKSDVMKNAVKETNKERYGVDWYVMSDDAQQKAHSDEAKEKQRKTNIEKYGVPYVLMLDSVRQKSYETMCLNNTLQTSNQENSLFDIIKNIFPDAIHHYRDDNFQYNVDFYIPQYKLFIEYQGSHFHNRKAYLNTLEDRNEYNSIKEKAEQKEAVTGELSQYSSILYTWTNLDVKKRNEALEKSLNYLEIYSFHNADDILNQLSFYIGCLTKQPAMIYSQDAIIKEYNYYKNLKCNELVDDISKKNIIVKNFQFCEFYKEEMYLYAHNPIIRRKVIQNRLKYTNKKEWQLTPADILSAFKKSGIYYGYSHFNPAWTNWFVNNYNIRSIYDPCGGWGHHLLGMLQCDRIIYNDFNKTVCENIKRMKKFLNITQLEVNHKDGTKFTPTDVDAWFMCPPYYNLEKYNDKSFKDYNDYKKFLNKIFSNWRNSSAKIFGIILREDYIKLIDCNFNEKYELNITDSHFSRINEKKNKEYFYIFTK